MLKQLRALANQMSAILTKRISDKALKAGCANCLSSNFRERYSQAVIGKMIGWRIMGMIERVGVDEKFHPLWLEMARFCSRCYLIERDIKDAIEVWKKMRVLIQTYGVNGWPVEAAEEIAKKIEEK